MPINPEYEPWLCQACDTYTTDRPVCVSVSVLRAQNWCQPCTDCCAWTCQSCNRISSQARRTYSGYGWTSICADCFEQCEAEDDDNADAPRGLHDYGHKPRANLIGSPGPWFGVEVETESVWGGDHDLYEAIDWWDTHHDETEWYVKYDGSLDNGAEFVSHPHTLDEWHARASRYQALFQGLHDRSMRAWSRPNCGLHVHIAKSAFLNDSHRARFGLLFSRNEDAWVAAARRRSNYASFDNFRFGGVIRKAKAGYGSHGEAVNFDGNRGDTIEVRIFRPSMAIDRVIGSIELVHAAWQYTRGLTTHDVILGALDFPQFLDFCSINHHLGWQVATGANFTKETSCA